MTHQQDVEADGASRLSLLRDGEHGLDLQNGLGGNSNEPYQSSMYASTGINLACETAEYYSWHQSPSITLQFFSASMSGDDNDSTPPNGTGDSEADTDASRDPQVSQEEHIRGRYATIASFRSWFPTSDPRHPQARTFRTWRSRRDVVLISCLTIAAIIFTFNLTGTIILHTKWGSNDGIGTIYQGSCARTQSISLWLHLLINLFSTLLLGSSNLCMQLLAAPTRKEIDKAHKRFQWLDIGVPSVRNLRYISRPRLVIWCVLGLSSLPLHFVYDYLSSFYRYAIIAELTHDRYNAAVFPSLPSNTYLWAVVTPEFLTGGYWSTDSTEATLATVANTTVWGLYDDEGSNLVQQNLSWVLSRIPLPPGIDTLQGDAINGTKFTTIDKITCLQHDSSISGNQSNLVMVSAETKKSNNSLLIAGVNNVRSIKHASPWMCETSNNFSCSALALTDFAGKSDNEREKNRELAVDNWNVAGYKIDYCLQAHRSTENLCNVEYSIVIMISTFILFRNGQLNVVHHKKNY